MIEEGSLVLFKLIGALSGGHIITAGPASRTLVSQAAA